MHTAVGEIENGWKIETRTAHIKVRAYRNELRGKLIVEMIWCTVLAHFVNFNKNPCSRQSVGGATRYVHV